MTRPTALGVIVLPLLVGTASCVAAHTLAEVEGAAAVRPATATAAIATFADDIEIECRVILAGKSGISGSVPRDLADMRNILRDRFKTYGTYTLQNTVWMSAWAGEEAVSMVFPDHILTLKVVSVDPKTSRAKVTVTLELDRGETLTETEDFVRSGQTAVRREREYADKPLEPLTLHRSALTVSPDNWRVVGGNLVRVSADRRDIVSGGNRGTGLSSSGITSRSRKPGMDRYLIIGLRTRANQP